MMVPRWVVLTQALDNEAPAVIVEKGHVLDDSRIREREGVVAWITSLSLRRSRSLEQDGVCVLAAGDDVLVEVPAEQADNLGRTSVVVLGVESVLGRSTCLGAKLVDLIAETLPSVGRTVSSEALAAVRALGDALERERRVRRSRGLAITAAVALVAGAIGAAAWRRFGAVLASRPKRLEKEAKRP